MNNKNTTVLTEIVFAHHPDFKSKASQQLFLKHATAVNVEHLVEQTMAYVGGYDFVNAPHYDFSDGTECKCVGILANPVKKNSTCHRGEISNVVSSGGVVKSGDIRCVVYNQYNHHLSYFYIPIQHVKNGQLKTNIHGTTQKGRVFFTWNRDTNQIPKLESYRLDSFEQLAVV